MAGRASEQNTVSQCNFIGFFGIFLRKMDLFSLEEDDCHELFITQSSSVDEKTDGADGEVLPDKGFIQPVSSYLRPDEPQYSDISDDDFMDLPSSQMPKNSQNNDIG